MFAPIFEWLFKEAPFLILLALAALVAWQVAKAYFTRLQPLEKNVADIMSKSNCLRHDSDIKDLKDMVRNIERILLKSDSALIDHLSITKSPRQLSALGIELYEKSGSKKLLTENLTYFTSKLEARKPLTALDVETESHSLLLSLSDEQIFYPIKNYLYRNPKFNEVDIDINTICFVMGLELRNAYLGVHTEIASELISSQ